MSRRAPPQGAGGGGGGGGYSVKASTSGQEGLYTFDQTPVQGGKIEASVGSGGFIEERTGSFANNGVPTVDLRGTEDYEDVLAPNENVYLYMWERDVGTVTGGTAPAALEPGVRPTGIAWTGSNFGVVAAAPEYLYEFDENFGVTGGVSLQSAASTDNPNGLTWDGTSWQVMDFGAEYVYTFDANFNLTGGSSIPTNVPNGITYDGTDFWITGRISSYLYQLDTDFNVIGGGSIDAANPEGIAWDGQDFIIVDTFANYIYVFDTNFNAIGGANPPGGIPWGVAWDGGKIWHTNEGVESTTQYIYEFAGTYDAIAGLQE